MIKTQEQLETFKKLDEEGKTLTKSVSWWKEESAKVLEEAEMLSLVEEEEIPFYGQEEFESYLNDMQNMQKRS